MAISPSVFIMSSHRGDGHRCFRLMPFSPVALLSSCRHRDNGHKGASVGTGAEFHVTFGCCEDGVVLADADIVAGVPLGAALADDDVAGNDEFAAEFLDAEATACGITSVAG